MTTVLDHLNTPPADRFALATRQIRSQARAGRIRHRKDGKRRQPLIVIDKMVAAIEERNLGGALRVDGVLQQRLCGLEAQVGLPVPPKVLRARNTRLLHGELLDWRQTVRDELIPDCRHLLDDADIDRADS